MRECERGGAGRQGEKEGEKEGGREEEGEKEGRRDGENSMGDERAKRYPATQVL